QFDRLFSFYRNESQIPINKKGTKMNILTQFKKIRIVPLLIAAAVTIVTGLPSQGLAKKPMAAVLDGIIDDFSPVLDANGPWQVSGQWSLMLIGNSGRGNFSVGLNMVRAENPDNRSAHTHQVTLSDAEVTILANGFQIS